MRVPRSKRHKIIKNRKRRLVVGMASILSIATVGVSQLPTQTFGLATSIDGINNSSFSTLPLFPATIEDYVMTAMAAAESALKELDNVNSYTTNSSDVFLGIVTTSEMVYEGQSEDSVPSEVYREINEQLETIVDLPPVADDTEILIELLNQQLIEVEIHFNNAKLNEESAWAVVSALISYKLTYAENVRLILLLEPAIAKATDYANQATNAVNHIWIKLTQIQDDIARLIEEQLQQSNSSDPIQEVLSDSSEDDLEAAAPQEDATNEEASEEVTTDEETVEEEATENEVPDVEATEHEGLEEAGREEDAPDEEVPDVEVPEVETPEEGVTDEHTNGEVPFEEEPENLGSSSLRLLVLSKANVNSHFKITYGTHSS